MRSFAARRVRHSALALLGLGVYGGLRWSSGGTLTDFRFFDGWALLIVLALPMLFAIRRRMPTVPLFEASVWMQLHAYAGLASALIFLVHTQGRGPRTGLDALLYCLFVAVFISGVVGMALNRFLPPRLIPQGPRLIYEKIAPQRRTIVDRIEALAMESVAAIGTSVISEFYANVLGPQLLRRGWLAIVLGQSDARTKKIVREIELQKKYLNDHGVKILSEIEVLVRRKIELDVQETYQFIMKSWPIVHAPLSYSLFVVILFHIVTIYSFSTGRP